MHLHVVWRLPVFLKEPARSEHSWDGQRYFKCTACGIESRFDPVFFSYTPTHCPACKAEEKMVGVVHARRLMLACRDCGHQSRSLSTEFEDLRCAECLSTNVDIERAEFVPPFPATFGDAMQHCTWGEDCDADLKRLLEELKSGSNFVPDFPGQMLSTIRFLQRLEAFSYAGNPKDRCAVINVEANLWRDYFRRTRVVEAGTAAIRRFEEAANLAERPLMKAMIEHNVAMAVYSMLAQLPEEAVELLSGQSHIRERAIAAAGRALAGYSTIEGFESRDRDVARVHHIIGDLLVAGPDRPIQAIDQALDHYNRAVATYDSDPRFVTNVRVSMVNAIWKLPEPTADQQAEAVAFLKAVLAVPEADRLWPEQHIPRMMLGDHYFDQGQFQAARKELELAAALVLRDADNADDELALYARVKDYVPVFSRLARVYGVLKRPDDTMAAMEALRAATIRLNTRSPEEERKRLEHKAEASISRVLGGTVDEKLRLNDPAKALAAIRKALPQAAVVSVDVCQRTVTTVIDAPGKLFGRKLVVDTRQLEHSAATDFVDLHVKYRTDITQPDPSREQKLNQYFEVVDPLLFAPLRHTLAQLGITEAIAMVPGPLYGVPIDIEASIKPKMTASPIRVRYVPSLGVAADLLHSRPAGNGRLLIVGYSGDDLPAVSEEVQAIAQVWGGKVTILHGTGLNKRAVLAELAKAG